MDIKLAFFAPSSESTLGKPLVAEPKTLTVIDKKAQGGFLTVHEYKDRTRERICFEPISSDATQSIDTFPEIDRLDTYKDPHLWADLNHRLSFKKQLMRLYSCDGSSP
jgi:hypothetical protein